LTALDDSEAQKEIAGVRDELRRRLGIDANVFCYAASVFGEREVRLAQEAGYTGAVTAKPGVNTSGQDPFRLVRLMVGWADDSRRFAIKLAHGGLPESSLARFVRGRRKRA
jgi:hypothetical protein